MNKPESLTIEVCSLCGEMAGQSAHGHSGQKWHWQQVEYVPKAELDRLREDLEEWKGADLEARTPAYKIERLRKALSEAWLGEPGVPAQFSNRLHGPTHNCDPQRCMIDQCPKVRALLAEI